MNPARIIITPEAFQKTHSFTPQTTNMFSKCILMLVPPPTIVLSTYLIIINNIYRHNHHQNQDETNMVLFSPLGVSIPIKYHFRNLVYVHVGNVNKIVYLIKTTIKSLKIGYLVYRPITIFNNTSN